MGEEEKKKMLTADMHHGQIRIALRVHDVRQVD